MTTIDLIIGIGLGYSLGALIVSLLQYSVNSIQEKIYEKKDLARFNEAVAKLKEINEEIEGKKEKDNG